MEETSASPPAPSLSGTGQREAETRHAWWKDAIVYQIYPRSFRDSDGDGVGDLRGIIEKLDYLKSLGIDVVWLNPIYPSPNDDNGYDVRDYEAISEEFGTMADFDELLAGLHARGIRLVLDLVANHSSDEHPWFVSSRQSRDSPYRDYYHWWPAEQGPPPERWSWFDVEANAWAYEAATDAWYLHYFSRKQPDLNWGNPAVRQAMYRIMRGWLDKGVDGFRLDAVTLISKDPRWPRVEAAELAARYAGSWPRFYSEGPDLHAYLQEMYQEVLARYDAMAVGEATGIPLERALSFVDQERGELDMLIHFEGVDLGMSPLGRRRLDPSGWTLPQFKRVYSAWSDAFARAGWGAIYLGNHDQPRMVSRWGDDSPEHRTASATLLHTFLLTMRATPFIYAGDEIGMTNIRFRAIEEYRDIETLNWYRHLREAGEDPEPFLEDWRTTARDNGRTPFQWDAGAHAGFTSATPWIGVHPDHRTINVAAQEADADSVLQYFRRLVRLRRTHPVLVHGDYVLLAPEHPHIYAYLRVLGPTRVLVLLNFSSTAHTFALPAGIEPEEVLLVNRDRLSRDGTSVHLSPWQALICTVNAGGANPG